MHEQIKTWKPGEVINNHWEVQQILGGPGKSGMGIIYVCYDRQLKQPIAIKTLQEQFSNDSNLVQHFMLEADTWVRLGKHPNIVQAKYVRRLEARNLPLIFLEFIAGSDEFGVDLSGWIRGGGLSVNLTLNFAIQICQGMIHADNCYRAMNKVFVHRDIKPTNILITRNNLVKITDFGLIKVLDSQTNQNKERMSDNIIGTLPYISPEQCQGGEVDIRSDIYSFGCVMYEMISGRPPFSTTSLEKYVICHLHKKPPLLNVNKKISEIIFKCLEKHPNKRFSSFTELEAILSKTYYELTGEIVISPSPLTLDVWEQKCKAVSLSNLGKHEEALRCFKNLLKANPHDSVISSQVGLEFRALNDLDNALEYFRRAIKANPTDKFAMGYLGDALREKGYIEEAITAHKNAVQLDPTCYLSHINLGGDFLAVNKWVEAGLCFRESLRLRTDNPAAHALLASVLSHNNEIDDAIIEYKAALKLKPDWAESHRNLGRLYNIQNKIENALSEYLEAVKHEPIHAWSHIFLGILYTKLGKLDLAIQSCKTALEINPNSDEAHLVLGIAYRDCRKMNLAINEFKEAICINPKSHSTHRMLAFTYLDNKNFDFALNEFRTAVTLRSDDLLSQYNIASCLENLNNKREALKEWIKYLMNAKNDPTQGTKIVEAKKHIQDLDQSRFQF